MASHMKALGCGLSVAGKWQPQSQRVVMRQGGSTVRRLARRGGHHMVGKSPRRGSSTLAVVNSKVEGEELAAGKVRSEQESLLEEGRASRHTTYSTDEGIEQIAVEEKTTSAGEVVALWVFAAVAFGSGVGYFLGAPKAEEFFAGYLLEQSLSVDNLFVFILIFKYFKVKPPQQEIVLNYGIWTAAVLRAVMTLAGVELVENFKPVLLFFAAILVYSSYGILTGGQEEEDEEDLENNGIVKFCRKFITVGADYDGDKFFTLQNGQRVATPLLLVLAVVELSDVVFAVDSIPAVFGVTVDPFIVYTSNMFAIVNLRALYSFISVVMNDLRFLDKSVAIVLGYIGMKMIGEFGGLEVPTNVSLGIVATVLAGGVILSYALPVKKTE